MDGSCSNIQALYLQRKLQLVYSSAFPLFPTQGIHWEEISTKPLLQQERSPGRCWWCSGALLVLQTLLEKPSCSRPSRSQEEQAGFPAFQPSTSGSAAPRAVPKPASSCFWKETDGIVQALWDDASPSLDSARPGAEVTAQRDLTRGWKRNSQWLGQDWERLCSSHLHSTAANNTDGACTKAGKMLNCPLQTSSARLE